MKVKEGGGFVHRKFVFEDEVLRSEPAEEHIGKDLG
jgi:hypothetical protein